MYNLQVAPQVARDLKEICDYITKNLENPAAANRLLKRAAKSINELSTTPGKGALLSSILEVETDYRFLVVNKYLVLYRWVGNDVFVNRVLYGKRNYMRVLFGDMSEEELE